MNIVLYQPEIPQNTGNIGRTCVALNMKLWLVRPMGFRLDSTQVKRAGLDYWEHLDYEICESWDDLCLKLYPDAGLINAEPMALATGDAGTGVLSDGRSTPEASAYGSGRAASSSGNTGAMWFFTKFATRSYTDVQFRSNDVLVFGSETSGLPDSIHQKYADQRLSIPMPGKVRSLNLATSVGIAAYEAFRQLNLLAK